MSGVEQSVQLVIFTLASNIRLTVCCAQEAGPGSGADPRLHTETDRRARVSTGVCNIGPVWSLLTVPGIVTTVSVDPATDDGWPGAQVIHRGPQLGAGDQQTNNIISFTSVSFLLISLHNRSNVHDVDRCNSPRCLLWQPEPDPLIAVVQRCGVQVVRPAERY